MNKLSIEHQYVNALLTIQNSGFEVTNDRTGVGTKKIFGRMLETRLDKYNFPIFKSKFVHFHSIVVELLWMLNGDDNTEYLKRHGVKIWDEWADEDGSLNGVYGKQWRAWDVDSLYKQRIDRTRLELIEEFGEVPDDWSYFRPNPDQIKLPLEERDNPIFSKLIHSIDQIQNIITTIKNNPHDRRQLVSAWNVAKVDDMNLPPCHYGFQTCVTGDKLNLMINQRSCDMFLGVPFNVSSYALLLTILSKLTGYTPGNLTWVGGDCHIYSNHQEQVEQYIQRYIDKGADMEYTNGCTLKFADEVDFTNLDTFLATTLEFPERIFLDDYKHLGSIKAPVAI